jgi:hypothetical protein
MLGARFAATRDLVSFLRYEEADRKGTRNPMMADGGSAGSPEAVEKRVCGGRWVNINSSGDGRAAPIQDLRPGLLAVAVQHR